MMKIGSFYEERFTCVRKVAIADTVKVVVEYNAAIGRIPELALENFTFRSCDFTEHLDGYTYEQTVTDFLKSHFHLKTFEYRLYQFAP